MEFLEQLQAAVLSHETKVCFLLLLPSLLRKFIWELVADAIPWLKGSLPPADSRKQPARRRPEETRNKWKTNWIQQQRINEDRAGLDIIPFSSFGLYALTLMLLPPRLAKEYTFFRRRRRRRRAV